MLGVMKMWKYTESRHSYKRVVTSLIRVWTGRLAEATEEQSQAEEVLRKQRKANTELENKWV